MGRVEELKGQREGSRIFHDGEGYFYHVKKENSKHINLKCAAQGCPVRAVTPVNVEDREFIKITLGTHNHPSNPRWIAVQKLRSILMERSATEETPFRQIFDEESVKVPMDVAIEINFLSVERSMQRARDATKSIGNAKETVVFLYPEMKGDSRGTLLSAKRRTRLKSRTVSSLKRLQNQKSSARVQSARAKKIQERERMAIVNRLLLIDDDKKSQRRIQTNTNVYLLDGNTKKKVDGEFLMVCETASSAVEEQESVPLSNSTTQEVSSSTPELNLPQPSGLSTTSLPVAMSVDGNIEQLETHSMNIGNGKNDIKLAFIEICDHFDGGDKNLSVNDTIDEINEYCVQSGKSKEELRSELCRVCGRYYEPLINIFSRKAYEHNLPDLINKYLPITVQPSDKTLPNNICDRCTKRLLEFTNLIKECQLADFQLQRIFQADSENESNLQENDIVLTNEQFDPMRLGHDYCVGSSEQSLGDDEPSFENNVQSDRIETTTSFDDTVSESRLASSPPGPIIVDYGTVSPFDFSPPESPGSALSTSRSSSPAQSIESTMTGDKTDDKKVKSFKIFKLTLCDNSELSTLITTNNSNEIVSAPSNTEYDVIDKILFTREIKSDVFIDKELYKVKVTLVKYCEDLNDNELNDRNKIYESQPPPSVCDVDSIFLNVTKVHETDRNKIQMKNKNDSHLPHSLIKYKCEHCDADPMIGHHFSKHLKVHHPGIPFKCPLCKQGFKTAHSLTTHLEMSECGSVECCAQSDQESVDENEDELNATVILNCDNLKSNEINVKDIEKSVEAKETYVFEIKVVTWKPSIKFVQFEPSIIFLDDLEKLSRNLYDILTTEIKNLLKVEQTLTVFDSSALTMMLKTKVVNYLKQCRETDKIIVIKSVISTDSIENNFGVDPILKELLSTNNQDGGFIQQNSGKTVFKPLKKLKELLKYNEFTSKPNSNDQKYKLKLRKFYSRTPLDSFECEQCGLEYVCRRSFLKHRKNNHVRRQCNYCDQVFYILKELKRHEKKHINGKIQPSEPEETTTLHCEECNIQFSSVELITTHNLFVHNIGEFFNCQLCDKKFATKIRLYIHERNVHTSYDQLCPYCGVMLKTVNALKSHIAAFHVEQEKALCHICSRTYKDRFKLNRHIKQIHENKQMYSCNICEKKFSLRKSCIRHKECHFFKKPANFCIICGFECKRLDNLISHLKKVHFTKVNKPADEQFPCLICDLSFENCDTLANHMLFHSEDDKLQDAIGEDEGSVECFKCNRFVETKLDLAIHNFFLHEELPFICLLNNGKCESRFWSKAALDAHQINEHKKCFRTLKCLKCNEEFSDKASKMAHLRNVH